MEGEVSGIAKLGIVLIALAVLIGLGFGIFQISKGTANTGVNDVQKELDGVSTSQYTTYDQTTITGTMVRSAVQDFEGEQVAVLISTQAWMNLLGDQEALQTPHPASATAPEYKGSGVSATYDGTGSKSISVPIVYAFQDNTFSADKTYTMKTSKGVTVKGAFINYNAIIGMLSSSVPSGDTGATSAGVTAATVKISAAEADTYNMAGVYFDTNRFVCTSGFAADASGRVQYNNITKNIQQTGTTEFIPTGAKFNSFLVKDASGTIMGIACQQIGQ